MKRSTLTVFVYAATIATCVGAASQTFAQTVQWNTAPPVSDSGYAVTPLPTPAPTAAVQAPTPTVEAIQAQQDARIRWGYERGYISAREQRRLAASQYNIEQMRRTAYADGWLTLEEQQQIYAQLSQLSADIERLMSNTGSAQLYYNQFYAPIPVWSVGLGWYYGNYVGVQYQGYNHWQGHHYGQQGQNNPPPTQQTIYRPNNEVHIKLPKPRDLLDPLGLFRKI